MSDKHNKRAPFPQRRLLASAVSLALLSGFAVAQESAVELDDVTVQGQQDKGFKVDKASSPKQTAALLDTPQTVNVIPETLFRQQNARTLTDVLRNTPVISFEAGENGFATGTNNFSLRGFNTSGSLFIDGARDNGSYTRDVFNVEQVEVFKGPAADNGRGGAGGYVNQVTKTPTLEASLPVAPASVSTSTTPSRAAVPRSTPTRSSMTAALSVSTCWSRTAVSRAVNMQRRTAGVSPRRWPSVWAPTLAPSSLMSTSR